MNAPGWPFPHHRLVVVDPDFDPKGNIAMKFRLTYAGPLMGSAGANNRVDNKQWIRRAFHPQLKSYWDQHPFLRAWRGTREVATKAPDQRQFMKDELAENFGRSGFRFVPLVLRKWDLSCAIDILFLRSGRDGDIVHGGDIDGRLKTLFDALRLPRDKSEMGRASAPLDGEDPFFCLLEDDALITQVSVETDMLLEPVAEPSTVHDARLVVTVSLGPGGVSLDNLGFSGR